MGRPVDPLTPLGVDFLLSLKGNQSKLAEEVESLFKTWLGMYPGGLLWHTAQPPSVGHRRFRVRVLAPA